MLIEFGSFALDEGRHQLLKAGADVHLSIKGYELLRFLLEARPRVVTKAELHDRLWPKTFVSDATLNSVVAEVRSALGEPARGARFIRTVHGIGYAFSGEAVDRTAGHPAAPPAALCWLTMGDRQFALKDGENVIGRDKDAAVPIEDATVSRRHARLVVGAGGATLEDLGSKNGSYVGGVRVTGAVPVTDGDHLKIGSVILTFRSLATPAPTATIASRSQPRPSGRTALGSETVVLRACRRQRSRRRRPAGRGLVLNLPELLART
ncbi:MAG: winged helix-turn-helix domain-containing protein [Planctomycetes bacterium]|nr:winged helix-turn-helix domain-containing protein [Planctomycetota bacterium]